MKSIRRYLIALTLLLLCVSLLSINAFAAREIASGTCGDNATWSLDSKGNMTISGKGAMDDYWFELEEEPWFSVRKKIKNVTIEEGITTIGRYAFMECTNLETVSIPNTVTDIYCYAFGETSLTEVTIPASVKYIGFGSFSCCSSLKRINVDSRNPYLTDVDGVLFSKDRTTLHQYPSGLTGAYTIPAGTTTIEQHAFSGCDTLTAINFPTSLRKINWFAFLGCDGLKTVTLPEGLKELEEGAFYSCDKLTTVTIPGSVQKICEDAFSQCKNLKSVTIRKGVTAIGDYAFSGCAALATVNIPNSVTHIGIAAFEQCALTEVTLPASVKTLDSGAFEKCTKLTSVTILGNVTEIPYEAFRACGKLTTVILPKTVTRIADCAFLDCANLRAIYYTGSKEQWNNVTIGDNNYYLQNARKHYHYGAKLETPSIMTIHNVANGMEVEWTYVENAEAYRLYIKTEKGWKAVCTTTGTSAIFPNAEPGKAYTFTVRCAYIDGAAFGGYDKNGCTATYVAQPAITRITNTSAGVKLTWKASGAEKYRVFVKTSKGWKTIGNTAGTSFEWKGAVSGKTYIFTVRGMNARQSIYTSSYNATGWRQKYIAQPAISKLENQAKGIRLSWKAVNGADRYRLYVKTAKGWTCIGNTTGTSFVWKGAETGKTYTFTIRCVNQQNNAFTSSYNPDGWKLCRT